MSLRVEVGRRSPWAWALSTLAGIAFVLVFVVIVYYEYLPTLLFRNDEGPPRAERLVSWRDALVAEDFAAWLREKLRLPDEQTPPAS